MVNMLSIESRRLQSCMYTLYEIVHGLYYFPLDIVSLRPSFSQRSDRQFLLHQPFARTNAFHSSFVPHATNLWNTLLRGSSHPHSVLLKLMLCITYNYFTSKVTAPQDAHKRLVLQVAEWLTAGFKGGARHELTT